MVISTPEYSGRDNPMTCRKESVEDLFKIVEIVFFVRLMTSNSASNNSSALSKNLFFGQIISQRVNIFGRYNFQLSFITLS